MHAHTLHMSIRLAFYLVYIVFNEQVVFPRNALSHLIAEDEEEKIPSVWARVRSFAGIVWGLFGYFASRIMMAIFEWLYWIWEFHADNEQLTPSWLFATTTDCDATEDGTWTDNFSKTNSWTLFHRWHQINVRMRKNSRKNRHCCAIGSTRVRERSSIRHINQLLSTYGWLWIAINLAFFSLALFRFFSLSILWLCFLLFSASVNWKMENKIRSDRSLSTVINIKSGCWMSPVDGMQPTSCAYVPRYGRDRQMALCMCACTQSAQAISCAAEKMSMRENDDLYRPFE